MTGSGHLSVVVPTLDRRVQLSSCLRALARMHSPVPIEVIVADDGGRFEPAVAERAGFGDGTLIVVRTGGVGPGGARNAGASAATGELIAFTDDDCEPEPGWAAALWRQHLDNPDAMLGGRTVNALPGNLYSRAAQGIADAAMAHHNRFPGTPRFFPSNNLAVPAAPFAELGGFDTEIRKPGGEDRDLCERWLELGRPLAEAKGAVVRHAHSLDLREFWQQQSAYGAGAFHHRRARMKRGGSRRLEPSLTSGVAAEAARAALHERDPGRLALLGVWQLANLFGFLGAAIRAHRAAA